MYLFKQNVKQRQHQNSETPLITSEDALVPIYVNEVRSCTSPYEFSDK